LLSLCGFFLLVVAKVSRLCSGSKSFCGKEFFWSFGRFYCCCCCCCCCVQVLMRKRH
jgi:hypothetical protein